MGLNFFLVPQILAHSAPPHLRQSFPRANHPAAQRAAARDEQMIRIQKFRKAQNLARIRHKLKLAHPSSQQVRLQSLKTCSLRLSLVHYKTRCWLLTQTLLLLLLLRALVSIIRPVNKRKTRLRQTWPRKLKR